ncbi:MAG: hypothetical protein M1834_001384 [Cirrosporium novae-zelandiae]|nr:MAG: hypothetical protein M1834_001384 [Cirrosporium novae-zelandiae]
MTIKKPSPPSDMAMTVSYTRCRPLLQKLHHRYSISEPLPNDPVSFNDTALALVSHACNDSLDGLKNLHHRMDSIDHEVKLESELISREFAEQRDYINGSFAEVRDSIHDTASKADIATLKQELRGDIATVREEFKNEMSACVRNRLVNRLWSPILPVYVWSNELQGYVVPRKFPKTLGHFFQLQRRLKSLASLIAVYKIPHQYWGVNYQTYDYEESSSDSEAESPRRESAGLSVEEAVRRYPDKALMALAQWLGLEWREISQAMNEIKRDMPPSPTAQKRSASQAEISRDSHRSRKHSPGLPGLHKFGYPLEMIQGKSSTLPSLDRPLLNRPPSTMHLSWGKMSTARTSTTSQSQESLSPESPSSIPTHLSIPPDPIPFSSTEESPPGAVFYSESSTEVATEIL